MIVGMETKRNYCQLYNDPFIVNHSNTCIWGKQIKRWTECLNHCTTFYRNNLSWRLEWKIQRRYREWDNFLYWRFLILC